MVDREFYFTPESTAIAEASGISEIATKIYEEEAETLYGDPAYNVYHACSSWHRADENIEPEIRDFACSPEFESLGESEKRLSLRAFNLTEKNSWAIIGSGEQREDRLFEIREYVRRVACVPLDRLTLTGAGGREFANFEPELFSDYARHGFGDRLEFMQFAGAWLCSITNKGYRHELPSITVPDINHKGMQRQVQMGGHIHGDFRIQELLIPEFGAVTPLGTETPYAPLEPTAGAAGYHSIEKQIVTAICAYVIDNDQLSLKEKQRLFEVLLTEFQPSTEPERGASFYGDFGDDNRDERFMALDLDSMRLNAVRDEPYMKSVVYPGKEQLFLEVRVNEQGELELKNTHSEQGIRFGTTDVPNLLALFLNIGNAEARTSQSSIVHAIYCAQKELLQQTEAGHIIFGDDN